MTEVEKLARTVRRLIIGVVALALAAGLFVVGSAGVRWGWDAATTSRRERVDACAEKVRKSGVQLPGGALWGAGRPFSACDESGGDVDAAIRLIEKGR